MAPIKQRTPAAEQTNLQPSKKKSLLTPGERYLLLYGERDMERIEKTVFISYRRTAAPWALAIFQDLNQHGFDVFFDFKGIASGAFESVIFENIQARAHFFVLLTPAALHRCSDPSDLFRREIETAIGAQRNIVPIMLEGFGFGSPGIDSQLWTAFATLEQYNGLFVYPEYFSEAMNRLREKYLNVPLNTVLHPVSPFAERAAQDERAAAVIVPPVTEQELRGAASPRYLFTVKVKYQDELERLDGTRAEEPYGNGGPLIIYDGNLVIARYPDVERWSRQQRLP
jgi:TIR domain